MGVVTGGIEMDESHRLGTRFLNMVRGRARVGVRVRVRVRVRVSVRVRLGLG